MTRHSIQLFAIGSALALLASAANAGQDLFTVKDLDPFTHVVRIPADAEQSSIRFEQVKLVKIPTKMTFTENARYCEKLAFRDPGGSSYCPNAAFDNPTAAYEVIYSYNGSPMASDEFGGKHFTFRAYFRPDDFSAATRKMFSEKAIRSDLAAVFTLTTSRDPERRHVADEANSRFCEGNYVDGSWQRKNPQCNETIKYATVTAPADYLTIQIGLSQARQTMTANAATAGRR